MIPLLPWMFALSLYHASAAQPEVRPIAITLRPAAEPVPALKFRLVPERRALQPGNAAVYYHRALLLLQTKRVSLAAAGGVENANPDELFARWAAGPLAEIPQDEARQLIANYQEVLKETELGSRQSECNWQFDQRTEGIALLMPEIQEIRALARLLAVKARLAILDHDIDAAFHWIQTGLVMGRHAANGPTVIQALVGIAINSVMLQCLQDLIQTPGTPSLYWAFADRPRPFIDMRIPLDGERSLLEKELPDLKQLDSGVWSVDQARRFADDLQLKLTILLDNPNQGTPATRDLAEIGRRLGIAAMASKVYPEAKQALIAAGRPADEVERMPVLQVAALHTILEYNRLRDDTYKWLSLPFWQSAEALQRAEALQQTTLDQKLANPLLTLFRLLSPSINAARWAQVRLERQFDALQVIEAIRIHMDQHGGMLPPSLDALELPTPIDPATGVPFVYTLQGDSATLSAPIPTGAPSHSSSALHVELKPAK